MSEVSQQPSYRPRIAVDFDGVIYARPKSERGNLDYSADPVVGSIHFLRCMVKPFEVVLHSARWAGFDGQDSCNLAKVWLIDQFTLYNRDQQRRGKPGIIVSEIMDALQLTATKPVAKVYIDDRAWKFEGTFPTAKELFEFKTWME